MPGTRIWCGVDSGCLVYPGQATVSVWAPLCFGGRATWPQLKQPGKLPRRGNESAVHFSPGLDDRSLPQKGGTLTSKRGDKGSPQKGVSEISLVPDRRKSPCYSEPVAAASEGSVMAGLTTGDESPVDPQEIENYLASVEAAAPLAPAETAAPTKARSGHLWSRTKVIASGTLALVAAVTGIISIIPILTADPSNVKHLEMTATAVESAVTEWAIPPAVLLDEQQFEEFVATFEGAVACDSSGANWLAQNGTQVQRHFSLSVRNAAKEGPMLALKDFRSTTAGESERGPVSTLFRCDPSGVVPQSVTYAKLLADDPGAVASVIRLEAGAAPGSSPIIPLSFNLAPGETGAIPVDLYSRNPVSGAIQTTVVTSDARLDVEIEGSEFQMPALLFSGDMYLVVGPEGLECQRVDRGALESCGLQELHDELVAATKQTEESWSKDPKQAT